MHNFVREAITNYEVSGKELERILNQLELLKAERIALGIKEPMQGERKLLREMAIARDTLLFSRCEAERAIDTIDERTLALILKLRYIDGLTAEQAAEKSGYCVRHVRRMTSKAKEEGII